MPTLLPVLAAVPAVWNVVAAAGRALADLGGEEDSDKERNTKRMSRAAFLGGREVSVPRPGSFPVL